MEFLIRNFDSTHADPDVDRIGCRKRGMCDAEMPDGHIWGSSEGLPKFVIIKCPEISERPELELRKIWRDNFDYEIVATRPAQGEFDVRVFETAQGLSSQNLMIGAKLTKVRDYLLQWGCSNFAAESNGGSFTFALWNAVRSPRFWEVSASVLSSMSFTLNSYSGATGIGNITVTVPEETESEKIAQQIKWVNHKITQNGGTVMETAYPAFTFTINRADVLTKFRADVKHRTERTYMYQQHRINSTVMDQAEDAGGVLELTKAELIAAMRNMAAE